MICPIDNDKCDGANGIKHSSECRNRCQRGKTFMECVLGMKALKPGHASRYEQPRAKDIPKPKKTFTHGTKYAWRVMKCECELCLDNRNEWRIKFNERRRINGRRAKGVNV